MWQHSPHAFEACSSVWGAYTVTGPLLGKRLRKKGLKPLFLPLPMPEVLPSLQHCFSSALRRSNCIGVCMDAYCVPVWWRSPSGTPQCRERAFVYYFRRAVATAKAVFSFPENLTFQKTMVATRADDPKRVLCTVRRKRCVQHCCLLLCACVDLCVALQLTASSWGPLM